MRSSTSCNLCCGAGGAIVCLALLAWFGIPLASGLLAAVGAGVAKMSPPLLPVIVGAFAVVGFGLWLGLRSHGRPEPFFIGLLGSVATVIGLLTWVPVAVLGFLVTAGSVITSQIYLRRA